LRSLNLAEEQLERQHLLTAARGRARLKPPESYPVGLEGLKERPFGGSAWEACLRLAVTLNEQGTKAAAELAAELGEPVSNRAAELATWLYTLATARRAPSAEAALFNALETDWPEIRRQVAQRSEGRQQELI